MICFIDFETTGIDVFRDEPIEFGAILVDSNLEIKNKFTSKISVNKSVYLTKRAFNIHNISIEDLDNSPTQKEVINMFFNEFGTDYRLGGWNISFDVSFLRKICHKNGLMVKYNKINHRHIDTQSLGFLAAELGLIEKNNNSLNDWVHYFGFNRSQNHSAVEDAKLTFEVYKKLLTLFRTHIK
jgi:DNA polymerase III epsilon subunit-like protein